MNVTLTGFMGAGKSSTGKRLAGLLGLPFIDTDSIIEQRHGPIAHIFAETGETEFRRIEREVIEEASRSGPVIIAVGGGAVLDAHNRRQLRRCGYIVHLAISPGAVWRRVGGRKHRPLLGDTPSLETIRSLMDRRAAAYADCDLEIRVDRRSPVQAARIIARWYGDKSASEATVL